VSTLQIGLIAAGVALVVAVIVYNVWQERRLRRRVADSHRAAERSAAEASRRSAERVEPTLGSQRAAAATPPGAPAYRTATPSETTVEQPLDVIAPPASFRDDVAFTTAVAGSEANEAFADASPTATSTIVRTPASEQDARKLPQPDHEIESLIPLTAPAPVSAGALAAGLHARIGKPLRWFGRVDARSEWQPLKADTPGRFMDIVACMLLADRNGAASRAQLESFARIVGDVASSLQAAFAPPDFAQEAARAEALDRMCADLDVQIGLTVQMPEPASIPGTRLRGVAEAAGFRLSPAGRFEFVSEDTGAVLYTLQNLRPDAFSAEMLRLTATNGVVFLLDVARLADPARAIDQMKMAAKRLAHTLGADLVDDNRRPLDDAALATIREQVETAADALRAVHIEPGSPRALALFSA
jgi:FtsZ-interacting cell division protein ZipA